MIQVIKFITVVFDPTTGQMYPYTIQDETGELIVSERYPVDKLIVSRIRPQLIDWETGYIDMEKLNAEKNRPR